MKSSVIQAKSRGFQCLLSFAVIRDIIVANDAETVRWMATYYQLTEFNLFHTLGWSMVLRFLNTLSWKQSLVSNQSDPSPPPEWVSLLNEAINTEDFLRCEGKSVTEVSLMIEQISYTLMLEHANRQSVSRADEGSEEADIYVGQNPNYLEIHRRITIWEEQLHLFWL